MGEKISRSLQVLAGAIMLLVPPFFSLMDMPTLMNPLANAVLRRAFLFFVYRNY